MRLLIIETSGNLWGSERALIDLLEGLGRDHVAVCCPPDRPLRKVLEQRGFRVYPHFIYALHLKSRWHRLRAALGVLRACIGFRPDLIYLNQSGSYRTVLPAAWLFGLGIVAHVRIFEDADYLAAQRASPKRLRGLVAISKAIESHIQSFAPLRSIPVTTAYDAYAPAAQGRPDLGAPHRRVVCIGRLVPVKGQDVLVEAMGLLACPHPDLECWMVGEGEEDFTRSIKALAAARPAAARISWLGFQNEVLPIIAGASVLVCSSHEEPLGRVIFEAWDAGVVPVAFAGSGGAAEVISAAGGGLLYATQDGASLARVIEDALALSLAERQALVENGRAWMRQNCDVEAYGRQLSQALSLYAKT